MKKILLIFIVVFMSGCASAPPAVINPVSRLNPIELKGSESKFISVKKVVNAIPAGTVIGRYQQGTLCVGSTQLTWAGNDKIMFTYEDILMKKLEEYNYSVVGKSESNTLFEDKMSEKSEILLGGRVIDVKANLCFGVKGFPARRVSKGEAFIGIEWEIYDKKVGDVVMKIKTEGNSEISSFSDTGDPDVFKQAYTVAVDNLFANKEFYKLLTTGR